MLDEILKPEVTIKIPNTFILTLRDNQDIFRLIDKTIEVYLEQTHQKPEDVELTEYRNDMDRTYIIRPKKVNI